MCSSKKLPSPNLSPFWKTDQQKSAVAPWRRGTSACWTAKRKKGRWSSPVWGGFLVCGVDGTLEANMLHDPIYIYVIHVELLNVCLFLKIFNSSCHQIWRFEWTCSMICLKVFHQNIWGAPVNVATSWEKVTRWERIRMMLWKWLIKSNGGFPWLSGFDSIYP